MRPLFVDLMFSWPPHGGGDVDIFHVIKHAAAAGLDPLLVVFRDDAWERGQIREELPFEVRLHTFTPADYTPDGLISVLRDIVSEIQPPFVFLGQGFWLKPLLALAVPARVPVVSRLHAHEAICLKDITRFRNQAPCPNAWFSTPDTCAQCALATWSTAIRQNATVPWLRELLAVRPWLPDNRQRMLEAWRRITVALVYNKLMADTLAPLIVSCRVVPSGIDLRRFPPRPWDRTRQNPPVIFMPGRAEDPVKGFSILLEACSTVIRHGFPLELHATVAPSPDLPEWVVPLGWLSHSELSDRYAEASLVAIPSVWEEPFGLTALEAMASARPVVATATGGLRDTVLDGETGLLVPPGDSLALAEAIRAILTQPKRAQDMGARGFVRAQNYDWQVIAEKYYRPLWRELAPDVDLIYG